jgi:heme/copper-type cytochrome/quinol oxidase subunit 2
LLAAACVILVGLFLIIRPRLPGGAAETRAIAVTIRAGTMSPTELTANEGDTLNLTITADRELAFHLHGYDLARTLTPGNPTVLTFEANLPGRFEIEDEETERQLGTLIVQPRGGR